MPLIIPRKYKQKLLPETTEIAIKDIKDCFQAKLSESLNLRRVTAPLFVLSGTGLNDDLNGVEHAVSFGIEAMGGACAEVVHSLAKWKRAKLAAYDIAPGYGLYTDMNGNPHLRRPRQPPFALCRPMGLGEKHPSGRPHARLSQGDSGVNLCSCARH